MTDLCWQLFHPTLTDPVAVVVLRWLFVAGLYLFGGLAVVLLEGRMLDPRRFRAAPRRPRRAPPRSGPRRVSR